MNAIIRNETFQKYGITAAVLFGSLIFGLAAAEVSDRIFQFTIIGLIGCIGILTIKKWFKFTPIILLLLSAFGSFSLDTGTQTTISDGMIFSAVAVGIWLFNLIFSRRKISLKFTNAEKLLVFFIFLVPISLIWSWLFKDAGITFSRGFIMVQLASSAAMVLLPLLFLLFRKTNISKQESNRVFLTFLFLGVIAYLEKTDYKIIDIDDRGLFPMWIFTVCVGLLLFNSKLKPTLKVIISITTMGWLYYSFYLSATWLSGWLPSAVALAFLVLAKSRKIFFILLIAVALILLLNVNFILDTLEMEIAESGVSRPLAWYRNIQLDLKHMLFGTGPAGYKLYYDYYYPGQNVNLSHNNYLDIFAQTGIFGILAYILFFLLLLKDWAIKLFNNINKSNWTTAKFAIGTAGLLGSITAMALGDWMIPFPYTQGIGSFDYISISWILLGMIETSQNVEKS